MIPKDSFQDIDSLSLFSFWVLVVLTEEINDWYEQNWFPLCYVILTSGIDFLKKNTEILLRSLVSCLDISHVLNVYFVSLMIDKRKVHCELLIYCTYFIIQIMHFHSNIMVSVKFQKQSLDLQISWTQPQHLKYKNPLSSNTWIFILYLMD